MKTLLLLAAISTVYANVMNTAKEEGKQLGNTGKAQAFSQVEHFPSHELLPPGGSTFDLEKAKESVEKRQIPHSEALDYLQSEQV